MKEVLISIQRPHTDNIRALIKTIEVRKNKPTIPTPFPVLIYETKAKGGCGKVIGEFVCDKITEYDCDRVFSEYCVKGYIGAYVPLSEMCLTQKDLMEYGKGKPLYGWHISDLKIYDKPKELREFSKYGFDRFVPIKRPPQSWCYVEVENA